MLKWKYCGWEKISEMFVMMISSWPTYAKSAVKAVSNVRSLLAVVVGDDVVVDNTVHNQIRMEWATEISFDGIVNKPCTESGSISAA